VQNAGYFHLTGKFLNMKPPVLPRVFLLAACVSIVLALPPAVLADEIRLIAKAGSTAPVTYVAFGAGLAPNTYVWLNADNLPTLTDLRATQRSLGFREVDYKAVVSAALSLSPVTPTTIGGISTYDYTTQNNKGSHLVAFWKDKDLPIVIGPDGKAYITDGHHTSAGYLAAISAAPREIVPGNAHVVLGHVVETHFAETPRTPDAAWWQARQAANNALLNGPNGNQLAQREDPGYVGLQPIPIDKLAMPTVPGKSSMSNDVYRSLTWGMVDPIVKTATTTPTSTAYLKGFSKGFPSNWINPDPVNLNPNTAEDINFVEFYWADFLRNRIVWNDNLSGCALDSNDAACAGKKNLIAAPVSFLAAVANGIALARSEVYRDQYGRTLNDYLTGNNSANTRTWASASIQNGLASGTQTYHMYLLDDSTVRGDIAPSALATVSNKLHIDTTAGQTISGALMNFASVDINLSSSIDTKWKDSAAIRKFLGVNPETTLIIPAGTGTVTFAGVNTYPGTTTVGAGKLVIASKGAITNTSGITMMSGAMLENHGQVNAGSYTQLAGASLGIATNAGGKVAPLTISGNANLDGTLTLRPGAKKWSSGVTYTVLTAGTIKGVFTGITGYEKPLTPKLTYGENSVTLTLVRKR
jgi:autotransporter-associated beta strand protein